MQILVGLGNPGSEYEHSRHNVGFMVAEQVVTQWQLAAWASQKKLPAEISKNPDLLVLKPQTFMNDSGVAVRAALEFYQKDWSDLSHLWVIHDDLDLEIGSFKIQLGTGPKVHNGLLSLYQHLKTEQFWHVRVGVDGRRGERTMPGAAYVLQNFTATEQQTLDQTFAQILEQLRARLS